MLDKIASGPRYESIPVGLDEYDATGNSGWRTISVRKTISTATMGRFAQILGIGVKGGVEIELPKYEFFPGEAVVGHLKLTIREAINAESFRLTLSAKEHIAWHQRQGKHDHFYHNRHMLFQQEIQILASATVFQPGEYVFPFAFQLPLSVPGSHSLLRVSVGHIRRVTSSIMYKLEATVKVQGMMTADVGGDRIIGVHALPKFAALPVVPKQDTLDHPVTFMCCFGKGRCQISASMSTCILDLFNGVLRVQASAKNNSTVAVVNIYVRMYQDLTVHIPDGFSYSGLRASSSRCVYEHKLPGLEPGASRDDIVVDFAMQQIFATYKPYADSNKDHWDDTRLIQQPFTVLPVMPTTDTLFVSVSYHVAIECEYAWCPDATLELPMQLHIPPFVVPCAPLPPGQMPDQTKIQ